MVEYSTLETAHKLLPETHICFMMMLPLTPPPLPIMVVRDDTTPPSPYHSP